MSATTGQPAAQHTPGPWYVDTDATTGFKTRIRASYICGPDQVCIADAHQGAGAYARLEANARLIAAAPDLLAELKACADWLAGGGTEPDCERLRAAIAKAEGRG